MADSSFVRGRVRELEAGSRGDSYRDLAGKAGDYRGFFNATRDRAVTMITQSVLGVGIVAAVVAITLKTALSPFAPIPLDVHSLVYEAGTVFQDRTITTDGTAFYAQWAAAVIDVATGDPVPWCSGSGSFPYQPGHKVKEFPLATWVGNENCTPENLNPGTYFLRASWQWGTEQTSKDSEPFEVLE